MVDDERLRDHKVEENGGGGVAAGGVFPDLDWVRLERFNIG